MSDKRAELKFLGRLLGTNTGWDGDLGKSIVIYNFQPAEGIDLPSGDLSIDEANGQFQVCDDNGNITQTWDIITILRDVPRR